MGIDWFGMVFGLGLAVSFGYWCTDFLQVQRVIVAKNLRAAQNGTHHRRRAEDAACR